MVAALVPVMIFSSCSKEFLERTPTTALETNVVLNDPDMLPSTVVGTMAMLSGEGYFGRNAIVAGELMTDVVTTLRGGAGHLEDLEKWNILPNTSEVASLWANSYIISASATQTIYSAKKLLADSSARGLSSTQINALQNAIAVSATLKAFAEFYLVQYFCVDVNIDAADVPGQMKDTKVGIILIKEKPLSDDPNDVANMSTLSASYKFIEETLQEALAYFELSKTSTYLAAPESRYFPTKCAAYLLQARVFLAQHKYQEAITAADNALGNLPAGTTTNLMTTFDDLVGTYRSGAASSEDIWSLNYTAQDNLSANSLQNYFASYGGTVSTNITGLFKNSDFRKNLYPQMPGKESCCLKYPNSDGVFNVPLMRVPEIYLTKAEAYAAQGMGPQMIEELFNVLSARDSSVKTIADIEGGSYRYGTLTSKEDMIAAVLDERIKEFAGEGFRWSDLRRNQTFGIRLNRPGNSDKEQYRMHFANYKLGSFALPVPYAETSTEQWANGHGIYDNGTTANENWQNNAWVKTDGDNYQAVDGLMPTEGLNLDDDGKPIN